MCLAVPAKLVSVDGFTGVADVGGITRNISLMLLPEAKAGDYVLVHAGFAMQIVTERDKEETDALLAEMNGAPRVVEQLQDDSILTRAHA